MSKSAKRTPRTSTGGKSQVSEKRTAASLTAAPYNPRKITSEKLTALGRAMATFGDLSGVVFNRRMARVVGGHQRLKHIPQTAEITITESFDPPTEQGTVALGYIEHGGGRWTYREVDWDEQTEMGANVAANKHGGEWDFPALPDLLSELDAHGFDMELTGFDATELEKLLAGDGGDSTNASELGATEFQIVVTCADEHEQAQVCNELETRGLKCRLLTL